MYCADADWVLMLTSMDSEDYVQGCALYSVLCTEYPKDYKITFRPSDVGSGRWVLGELYPTCVLPSLVFALPQYCVDY